MFKLSYSKIQLLTLWTAGIFASLGRWDGEFFPKSIMALGVGFAGIGTIILFMKYPVIRCKSFLKESRNSRIDFLCDLLALEERIYKGDINCIKNEITYKEVDCKLEKLREESMSYLKKALEQSLVKTVERNRNTKEIEL